MTAIKFVFQHTVYEVMNMWSDLKHLRVHEHRERDPRDPVAVDPSLFPSIFQDLAESGLLEPEAALVSKVVTRATRLPTICSIFLILVVWAATI